MRITYSTLICATLLGLLTACATPPGTSASPSTANAPQSTSTAATSAQTEANAPEAFNAGTVAEFGMTETKLDAPDIANISKNIDAFKRAKSIEITGYCDRKDNVLGAQQVALSRARAVQAELVKQGVVGSKFRLKYRTTEARHSVDVVLK